LQVSLVLRNLGGPLHVEFKNSLGYSEIERTALLELRWSPP
jgi:hypothetical protein